MRGQDFGLLSIEETLEALLPVRKSPRWLNTYLNNNPTDSNGQPLYRRVGRDKLVYFRRLIESLPCPSRSSPVAIKRRRRSTSEAATSASQWTKAAALTGDPSLANYSSGSKVRSNGENIRHVNFHAAAKRGRS